MTATVKGALVRNMFLARSKSAACRLESKDWSTLVGQRRFSFGLVSMGRQAPVLLLGDLPLWTIPEIELKTMQTTPIQSPQKQNSKYTRCQLLPGLLLRGLSLIVKELYRGSPLEKPRCLIVRS